MPGKHRTRRLRAWLGAAILVAAAAMLVAMPAAVLANPGAGEAGHAEEQANAAPVQVIDLRARQFAYAPGRVTVQLGQPVRFVLSSEDVTHGFSVDGYDIDVKVPIGEVKTVEFTPDRPGKFRFRCSVTCGPLHPFMVGEMVVEPNRPLQWAVGLTLLTALGIPGYLALSDKVSANKDQE